MIFFKDHGKFCTNFKNGDGRCEKKEDCDGDWTGNDWTRLGNRCSDGEVCCHKCQETNSCQSGQWFKIHRLHKLI